MIYTCKRCGQQFEATHKTAVCKNCKTSFCIICGKEFELPWPYTAKTCSSACRGKYGQMTGQQKRAGEAGNRALKKKPHVWTKKCVLCGTEFTTTSARKKYCDNDHYGPCPVCGKQVKIKELYLGPQACSEECRQARIQQTCLEKYGNTCAVNSEFARAKAKETCLEKYGTDHFSKTVEYQKKYEATCKERYGVARPLQNEAIKEKTKQTNQQRYGGNSPMCSEEVKQKSLNFALEHHGGFGFESAELNERIQSTMLERYGVDNPMKSEVIRKKAKETCLEKYGTEYYGSSIYRTLATMTDPSKIDNYLAFVGNPSEFIKSHYTEKPTQNQLCQDIGFTYLNDLLVRLGCEELVQKYASTMENEVIEFLRSCDSEISIVHNCRSVITPYEIDIYLPDYKLGIECNPTATHNSTFKDPWGLEPKSSNYHSDKSTRCENRQIQLFHIFGYEWNNKKEIIQSMLRNLIHCNENIIYARNTEVVQLSDSECKDFLNYNHRQGYVSCSIRLGLVVKDSKELVSVMTFSPPRSIVRKDSDVTEGTYELVRFCNKCNSTVIGSASKLFKYFLSSHVVNKVISYSDIAHTSGSLYRVLGFEEVYRSEPGYTWVSLQTDKYFTRSQCQKHNLPKLFHEPDLDIENMTEREIMASHGYAQVFDSGVIRWEYTV